MHHAVEFGGPGIDALDHFPELSLPRLHDAVDFVILRLHRSRGVHDIDALLLEPLCQAMDLIKQSVRYFLKHIRVGAKTFRTCAGPSRQIVYRALDLPCAGRDHMLDRPGLPRQRLLHAARMLLQRLTNIAGIASH